MAGLALATPASMTKRAMAGVLALTLTWACGGEDGSDRLDPDDGAGASGSSGGSSSVGGGGTGASDTGGNGTGGSASGGSGGGGYVPPEVLFFDDFEYAVSPGSDAGNLAAFQAAGWTYAKAINVTGSHGGNLYTTDSIEGSTEAFPGVGSGRVLCVNSLAGTLNTQTDFYLQYGDSGGAADALPGDVWIQFWIYPNRHGAEQTGFHGREKFLYPCDGDYPCNSGKWLWLLASSSYQPYNETIGDGNAYIVERDNQVGTVNYSLADEWDASKIGQTDTAEYIAANRWTLVKLHFDTSTTTGSYEAWLRPRGGGWTKVAEWLGGVTPNFTWEIPSEHVGGHRVLRMPTTFPANATDGTEDAWIYLDDFAIANSEDALPSY